MTDDAEHEHARIAGRAREAEERARAYADRIAAEAKIGGEAFRQQGVIYGGLIGVAVLMVQPFLTARTLDTSARVSIVAFAVAIPLLAALVLVNRQEAFRSRRSAAASVTI